MKKPIFFQFDVVIAGGDIASLMVANEIKGIDKGISVALVSRMHPLICLLYTSPSPRDRG